MISLMTGGVNEDIPIQQFLHKTGTNCFAIVSWWHQHR